MLKGGLRFFFSCGDVLAAPLEDVFFMQSVVDTLPTDGLLEAAGADQARQLWQDGTSFETTVLSVDGAVHRWVFAHLRSTAVAPPAEIGVKVVRLGLRRTLRVDLHVAMPGRGQRPAVMIGHLRASESWATPKPS